MPCNLPFSAPSLLLGPHRLRITSTKINCPDILDQLINILCSPTTCAINLWSHCLHRRVHFNTRWSDSFAQLCLFRDIHCTSCEMLKQEFCFFGGSVFGAELFGEDGVCVAHFGDCADGVLGKCK